VNLVVVSNRVARGKTNEPMTGGLAAAITIPICASWTVGSTRGQVGLFMAIATSLLVLLFAFSGHIDL